MHEKWSGRDRKEEIQCERQKGRDNGEISRAVRQKRARTENALKTLGEYVPVTRAVVVAIAGVIFPAIPRAVWRSASGIL